jgi:coenzyme F420-reducing hydrogenase beta subunit
MIQNARDCNCTGCSACANACPVSAITMEPDKYGFLTPKVDNAKCIQCKKCLKCCPSLNPVQNPRFCNPKVFAAWNKDEQIRLESTSGGVFSALAEAVLRRGGCVVGAEYDDKFEIHHTIIHSAEDIKHQRQSKYAQSDLGTVFSEIRKLLNDGKIVLFCGTPCQSAGLQKFLAKEYDNLFSCDFICRGVISPKIYRKFLHDMHPQSGAAIHRVHFKNKDFGWNRFSTKLTFEDGSFYQRDRNDDYYMRGYLQHNLYLRDCCYQCDYKTIPRVSDLSLGDFWGIGNYDASLDNEQGTSVILVNSEKGQQLLDWSRELLVLTSRTLDEVIAGNVCVLSSAERGKYREYFFKHIDKVHFAKLIARIDKMSVNISFTDRVLQRLSAVKHWMMGDGK